MSSHPFTCLIIYPFTWEWEESGCQLPTSNGSTLSNHLSQIKRDYQGKCPTLQIPLFIYYWRGKRCFKKSPASFRTPTPPPPPNPLFFTPISFSFSFYLAMKNFYWREVIVSYSFSIILWSFRRRWQSPPQ